MLPSSQIYLALAYDGGWPPVQESLWVDLPWLVVGWGS